MGCRLGARENSDAADARTATKEEECCGPERKLTRALIDIEDKGALAASRPKGQNVAKRLRLDAISSRVTGCCSSRAKSHQPVSVRAHIVDPKEIKKREPPRFELCLRAGDAAISSFARVARAGVRGAATTRPRFGLKNRQNSLFVGCWDVSLFVGCVDGGQNTVTAGVNTKSSRCEASARGARARPVAHHRTRAACEAWLCLRWSSHAGG